MRAHQTAQSSQLPTVRADQERSDGSGLASDLPSATVRRNRSSTFRKLCFECGAENRRTGLRALPSRCVLRTAKKLVRWPSSESTSWLVTVPRRSRSEEHTSELQSQSNLVCRLLLEKKKRTKRQTAW